MNGGGRSVAAYSAIRCRNSGAMPVAGGATVGVAGAMVRRRPLALADLSSGYDAQSTVPRRASTRSTALRSQRAQRNYKRARCRYRAGISNRCPAQADRAVGATWGTRHLHPEGGAQCGAVGTLAQHLRSGEVTRQRGGVEFVMPRALVPCSTQAWVALFEQLEAEFGRTLQHRHQPPFEAGPNTVCLPFCCGEYGNVV